MTVTYSARVATCRGLGNFWRLLARWKGSIYKLVWLDMSLYMICYFSLSCFYRFYLAKEPKEPKVPTAELNGTALEKFNQMNSDIIFRRAQRKTFEKIVEYCDSYGNSIPLSFILGFYVGIVMARWWDQFKLLPWPDALATLISTNVQGQDERGRLMRRTIMRYLNFSFVFAMSLMATPAKKRFPTMNHMVESGFLLPHEQVIIDHLNQKTIYSKYWVPIVWAGSILSRARRENRLPDDMSMNEIISQFTKWRGGLGDLLGYDWATIPLMYTQGVTLAVNLYFLSALIGKQFIQTEAIDLYVPIFTMIEFFFYFGWLKVAETLVNPFGEDDDDFEVNWLIDRNLQVSYLIVDEMHHTHPPMVKDSYWDAEGPIELPYTEAAAKYKTDGQQGSANYMEVEQDKNQLTSDDLEMVTVKNNRSKLTGILSSVSIRKGLKSSDL